MTRAKDRLFDNRNPMLWGGAGNGLNRARRRLAWRRLGLPQDLRTKIVVMFDQALRRVLTGYASQHRTPQARQWRCVQRLKQNRP